MNYLSADRPLWFTLADCVASKLLTGKPPKVVRAIRFLAKQPQPSLRAVEIAGNREFRVDPYKNDFYKRVIELRQRVKADLKEAKKLDPHSQETKSLLTTTLPADPKNWKAPPFTEARALNSGVRLPVPRIPVHTLLFERFSAARHSGR